jgi:hypothetical protein
MLFISFQLQLQLQSVLFQTFFRLSLNLPVCLSQMFRNLKFYLGITNFVKHHTAKNPKDYQLIRVGSLWCFGIFAYEPQRLWGGGARK